MEQEKTELPPGVEELSYDDVLNRVRDMRSKVALALEEMDRYAVVMRNELMRLKATVEGQTGQIVTLAKKHSDLVAQNEALAKAAPAKKTKAGNR